MIRRWGCALLVFALALGLSGCWSYRGLDQLTIVAGVAIDKNPETGNYHLSFEFVNLATQQSNSEPKGEIVESEGRTIFDAVRNAKTRLNNKLYFGHTQLMIISQQVAQEQEIASVLDWFMRDAECRETMYITVSKEKTAKAILDLPRLDQNILSLKIQKMLEQDKQITSSTLSVELYNAFDMALKPGKDVAVAALQGVRNNGSATCEIAGTAVFKQGLLAGFLSTEESKYLLFALGELEGGVLPFSTEGEEGEGALDASLEITSNVTSLSLLQEGEELPRIRIKVETKGDLNEYMPRDVELDKQVILNLEKILSKKVQNGIEDLIHRVQRDYGADIFGFGNLIYKQENALWKQLEENWNEVFPTLQVEVEAKVSITSTAFLSK